MTETWTQSELQEYIKSGRTPNRDRVADPIANLESVARHAPLPEKENSRLNFPVRIVIESYRRRLADADGVSAKYAIDSLIKCGILPDDGPQYVAEVAYKQTKSKEEKTVIVIEEIESGKLTELI